MVIYRSDKDPTLIAGQLHAHLPHTISQLNSMQSFVASHKNKTIMSETSGKLNITSSAYSCSQLTLSNRTVSHFKYLDALLDRFVTSFTAQAQYVTD